MLPENPDEMIDWDEMVKDVADINFRENIKTFYQVAGMIGRWNLWILGTNSD